MALALHTLSRVKRLFLSAPTTCALLLGTGLLLRAQVALRSEPDHGDARVKSFHAGPRAAAAESDEAPDAAEVGKGKQALGRRATEGEWREQRRSHRGNAEAPRPRAARRPKRKATGHKVVIPRWGKGAGGAGEGGGR